MNWWHYFDPNTVKWIWSAVVLLGVIALLTIGAALGQRWSWKRGR